MYKTTKKNFQEFEKECWYWIEYFGLKNWEWEIYHEDLKNKNVAASYEMSYHAQFVEVYLNTDVEREYKNNKIKLTAFHEICHVLLAGITQMALEEFNEDIVHREGHKIIQILVNTIFKEKRK